MHAQDKTMIFRVTLIGIKPIIWREREVPTTYSFWDHQVAIQDVMGWYDYHLHIFRVLNSETAELEEIGIPDEEEARGGSQILPGWEVAIGKHFLRPGDKAIYEYDFGDGWEHEIILEQIADARKSVKYPRCLNGQRACPPEDCGGVPGYEHLLGFIKNPEHPEYKEMMEWLGDKFDPEDFDVDSVTFEDPKKSLQRSLHDK